MSQLSFVLAINTHYKLNREDNLICIMTPEKHPKTLELSKHRYPESTLARNDIIFLVRKLLHYIFLKGTKDRFGFLLTYQPFLCFVPAINSLWQNNHLSY